MKYDVDNNDIAVVALLILGLGSLLVLKTDASTIIGTLVGFIGRGVAAKTPNGNGAHGGAAPGSGKDLTKRVP